MISVFRLLSVERCSGDTQCVSVGEELESMIHNKLSMGIVGRVSLYVVLCTKSSEFHCMVVV